MENTNIILSENIQKYRKKSGLTQEELAGKLGVTFQAVSKWENGRSAPDIMFLPKMADIFGCSIDEIFSRSIDMSWGDDDVIRIFQTKGRKIVKTQDDRSYIEVSFPRNCNEMTRQYFKVEVYGNIVCDSSINGDVVCHGNVNCYEINGDLNAETVTVKTNKEDKLVVTPFLDPSTPDSIKEYVSKVLKEQLDNNGSTNKLLRVIVDNIDGNFPLTDENIERLLDAYRDLYKGMQNN